MCRSHLRYIWHSTAPQLLEKQAIFFSEREFGKGFVLGHLEETIYSVAFLHLFHSPTSSENSTRLDGFQLNTTCVWDGWILKTIIWCSAQNPLLCRLRWSKKTVNFPVVYWPQPSVKGGPQEGRITTVTSAQKNKAAVWNQDHVLTRTQHRQPTCPRGQKLALNSQIQCRTWNIISYKQALLALSENMFRFF